MEDIQEIKCITTFKGDHAKKLIRLRELFGDTKYQTTLRKLIEDFEIKK